MKTEKKIRRALELVRDGLRSGAIPAHNFDIMSWRARNHCGTVACIGGWTELLLHRAGFRINLDMHAIRQDEAMHDLFYSGLFSKQTPDMAANAIDAYLAATQE